MQMKWNAAGTCVWYKGETTVLWGSTIYREVIASDYVGLIGQETGGILGVGIRGLGWCWGRN